MRTKQALATTLMLVALAAPRLGAQWVADVQKEWEANGSRWFEPVAAEKPHATIRLQDTASRDKVGAFEVWVLIDGARVKDWPGPPLLVSPGAHCIRIDMVAVGQKYQGSLGKYWPWLAPTEEAELRFTRDERGFSSQYQKVVITTKGLLDQKRLDFEAGMPDDQPATYAYCMKQVGAVTP